MTFDTIVQITRWHLAAHIKTAVGRSIAVTPLKYAGEGLVDNKEVEGRLRAVQAGEAQGSLPWSDAHYNCNATARAQFGTCPL